jgi:hypothetical protein
MNSVYDRPLFANKKQKRRDARTKLLNMGGIIASSPELMQAAQPMQTMMSPVTQQRNMNQGGYIPGYDEGGFIHNMKHRREDAGLPSIMNQIKTGTIPPVDEQPSFNFLKNMFGGGSDVDVSATAGTVTLPGSEEVVTEATEVVDPDLNTNEITTEEFTGPEFEEVEAARQAALDILTSDGDELAKANQLAAQVAGEPLSGTEEEQTAQYKDLIQRAFGKKANAKTIAGLNRQITGFTIAAGKDPRAVVNIANGLKAGAEAQKAQLEADQTRSDLIAKATLERGFEIEDRDLENTRAVSAAKLLSDSRKFIAGLNSGPDTEKTRAEIRFGQARDQILKRLMAESEYTNEFLEDGTKNPKYLSIEQIGERSNELAAGMEPNAPSAVAFLKRSKGTTTGTARDWVKNPPKTQKEYNEVPVGTEFFDVGKNRNFTKK